MQTPDSKHTRTSSTASTPSSHSASNIILGETASMKYEEFHQKVTSELLQHYEVKTTVIFGARAQFKKAAAELSTAEAFSETVAAI